MTQPPSSKGHLTNYTLIIATNILRLCRLKPQNLTALPKGGTPTKYTTKQPNETDFHWAVCFFIVALIGS